MGIFKNIIRKIKNLSISDPKAWNPSLWNLTGSQSLSGEVVTEETALTYSAVWNAVSLISGTVGSLPLHLMQRQGNKKRVADNDPLYYVMHDRPNPYMTAMAFREMMMAHILTWGNAYAEKVYNGFGEVYALWPITPNRVLKCQFRDDILQYEIDLGTERKWLSRDKIMHIPGLGFDGFVGYSVIAMARKSIGLGMAMETYGSLYFGNGTHPGIIVKHPDQLSAQAHSNLKNSLNESYSGLGNTHRLMLLEENMTFENVGLPPEDSQFLESRQFQIPEIARWYNLPPHKLKDLTKSSFNNIEAEQISFVTDSILPWLIRLEQNYHMQLLTEGQQKREKLYFKHVVEGLLRGDSKSRGEFYQLMKRNGFFTINEVRAMEDKNPHPNPYADELWFELNTAPLSKIDEYIAKNTDKTTLTEPENQSNLIELKQSNGRD